MRTLPAMAGPIDVVKASKVFVPGGRPTLTYVPRAELALERSVEDYLDERHKVLSVSGPTKTGKTVLLRNQVSGAIWLSGGTIETIEDFWSSLADALGVDTETGVDGQLTHTETEAAGGGVSGGFAKADYVGSDAVSRGRTQIARRKHSSRDAARRELMSNVDTVVVIDDFHYIPQSVQLQIARGLKDLVFEGVGCIVAAVPHRAYDVVRVEKEMTGRVVQLEVGFWSAHDLREIASRGFAALNVRATEEIVDRLVAESFQSPHLMQEFCRELCKANGVSETRPGDGEDLRVPEWDEYFTKMAPGTSKAAFDLLARGPRQRSDRKPRLLVDGTETDIYGAVLRAIAKTGPLTALTYEQLRGALREVLSGDVPQRHEVTRVLEEMSKIAREQLEGEPVVDYDAELSTLYISDPYFAYWLRWGSHNAAGASAEA